MNLSSTTVFNLMLYAGMLATFMFVGRSSLKKQTIEDQAKLIKSLQNQNADQAKQIFDLQKSDKQKDARIRFLEDLIWNGNTRMVDPGPGGGYDRGRRSSRPASPPPPEDDDV